VIVDKSFTKEWIQTQHAANKGADPGLIERQIYAFALLHYLAKSGKEFIFKGGTSLHLILPDHKRLSTDVDIVGSFTSEELQKLIAKTRFVRVEENIRKQNNIPKRHFKFFYTSSIDGRESYVLLDTLEAKHTYPKIEEKLIASKLFETDEKVKVKIPTLEGILGDKLTVFAPHTVGIRYGHDKSMEIVKQLFDIGELFDYCRDVKAMTESYNATQAQESKYRKSNPSRNESLDDTIGTSFLVSQYLLKGFTSNAEIKEIATGLKQIENHLLGVPFKIDHARIAAAKIALWLSLLRRTTLNSRLRKCVIIHRYIDLHN
jgi:predicted nucleotidyltransferase component of viral defense system